MRKAVCPEENLLIAALPQAARDRMATYLEPVDLPLGQVLYDSGDTEHFVYFPIDCIVSLLYLMNNGASTEMAVVGRDGVVGIATFMGGESMSHRASVQSAGIAYRLASRHLKEEFSRHGALAGLMLRYTQSLITQIGQTAVCNRHHSIDQRLCRRLLLSLDRVQGDELTMTQERLASLLGVRREGVTEAAIKLHRMGIIFYRRGHIRVLNRGALERLSCECYAVVKKECDRLLPRPRARAASGQKPSLVHESP